MTPSRMESPVERNKAYLPLLEKRVLSNKGRLNLMMMAISPAEKKTFAYGKRIFFSSRYFNFALIIKNKMHIWTNNPNGTDSARPLIPKNLIKTMADNKFTKNPEKEARNNREVSLRANMTCMKTVLKGSMKAVIAKNCKA